MSYSKHSREIMNFFLPIADQYLISTPNIEMQEKILSNFYKEIKIASKIVKKQFNDGLIQCSKVIINNVNDIPTSSLLSSFLVPPIISSYIKNESKNYLHYSCNIYDRKINIYIILFNQLLVSQKKKIDNHVIRMLTWLRIAFMYSSAICGKNLKIYVYWTNINKEVPKDSLKILGPEHCNSGLTTFCSINGSIVIFRKEEWFKVFIHETFHILGLDFSKFPCNKLNDDMYNLMPIHSKFNLYEAYSETWATIMNCLFCAYELLGKNDNEEDFLLYADFLIQYEKMFSMYQCVKVLDFMGLKYTHLYGNTHAARISRDFLYRENTNVFAYYILKMILLYNFGSFMIWCLENNINLIKFDKMGRNLNKFFSFIKAHYNNPKMVKGINNMYKFYSSKKSSNTKMNKLVTDTLRMTICELD